LKLLKSDLTVAVASLNPPRRYLSSPVFPERKEREKEWEREELKGGTKGFVV